MVLLARTFRLLLESIQRGNFAKYLFLGVWSSGKSYLFLKNFEKALLENLICYYQKQPASYFTKISVLFFQERLFYKKFLEHIKFSRRLGGNKNTSNFPGEDIILLLEHIKFSRRTKYVTRTHLNFLGEAKCKNTSKFPEELSQNSTRTHTIF